MSIHHGNSSRHILPRWRASGKAPQSGGFSSLKPPLRRNRPLRGDDLSEIEVRFTTLPDIGVAAELLSVALLEGKEASAKAAASFIEGHAAQAPRALLRFAQSVFSANTSQGFVTANAQVSYTRKLLRLNPDNPMLWSDLARHFASHGNPIRAKRYMRAALQLAPDHSWMLRTAARFFVHQGDVEAAHSTLATHPRTKQDPWLIAAELACAQVAGKAPRFWKQANDILKFDKFAPKHISELATAVAMLELESSNGRKKARKLIMRGLVEPTENTLAQVFWAKQEKHLGNGFGLDELVREANDAYEADYRRNLGHGDLLAALNAAQTWADDEPFAARPKAEVAYIASLFDNYALTAEMERAVLRIDGTTDATLRMNALFSRLSSGTLTRDNDQDELSRIYSSLSSTIEQRSDEAYHAIANLGLWHYRYGELEQGRLFYQKAIEIAEKRHLLESAAQAAVFAAREAILCKDPNDYAILSQAKDLVKRSKSKTCEFYLRKLDALIISPGDAEDILSPNSAERFLSVDVAPSKDAYLFRIQREGDRLVVFLPPAKQLPRS